MRVVVAVVALAIAAAFFTLPDATWADFDDGWAYRAFGGVPLGFAVTAVVGRDWGLALSALGAYAALTLFAVFCLADQEQALTTLDFGSRYGGSGTGATGSLYLGAGVALFAANAPLAWFLLTKVVGQPVETGPDRSRRDRFRSMVHGSGWRTTEEVVAEREAEQQEASRRRKAARRAQRERERAGQQS